MDLFSRNNIQITGNPESPRVLILEQGGGTYHLTGDLVTDAFRETYRLILYVLSGIVHSDFPAFNPEKYRRNNTRN